MNTARALELLREIEARLHLEENSVPSWTLDEVEPLLRELRQIVGPQLCEVCRNRHVPDQHCHSCGLRCRGFSGCEHACRLCGAVA